jgi:tetratricopeptide (TPR) repeat protein
MLVVVLDMLVCVITPGVRGQVEPSAPARTEPGFVVIAGTEVTLKSSQTPLLESGQWVPAQDHLLFRVEEVQEDKVRLVSRDKAIRGWVASDQIVPLDHAIRYFSTVLSRDRRNTNAYWTRARLWMYYNDPERALANLDLAIRLQPDQARLYITRGLAHLREKHFDEAIADCDKAIELDSHSGRAYEVRALARLSRNKDQNAQADLDQALRLDDTDPGQPNVRASAEQAVNPGPEHLAAYDGPEETRRAISPEPKSAAEFVARGDARCTEVNYDDAIADYTAALRLNPAYAPAYAARARAWAGKHYRERELADCNEAVRLDPNNTNYRVARANSWSAQGMHGRALADYNDALRMEPANPAIWVARGKEWQRDYKVREAVADYTRAIQLDPRYAPAYINRGYAWKVSGAYDRAVQEFAELARIDPDNPLAHQSLARILATAHDAKCRDGRRAVEEATRACELTKWQDPDSIDTLAAACAESGDFENAVKWQTRAIALVRQNAPTNLSSPRDLALRRAIGFEDRLAFYKSRRPTRE